MKTKIISGLVIARLPIFMVGSAIAGSGPANEQRARDTIEAFKTTDSSIDTFFGTADGYAVFPEIAKGAVVVDGAAGDGTVFEGGTAIGSSRMTQLTVGLQLGSQTYSEVIFFKNRAALDKFEGGDYEIAAGASALLSKRALGRPQTTTMASPSSP